MGMGMTLRLRLRLTETPRCDVGSKLFPSPDIPFLISIIAPLHELVLYISLSIPLWSWPSYVPSMIAERLHDSVIQILITASGSE